MRYYIKVSKVSDTGSLDYRVDLSIKEDGQPFILCQPIEITMFADSEKEAKEKVDILFKKLGELK